MEKSSRRTFLAGVGQAGVTGALSAGVPRSQPRSELSADGFRTRAYWVNVALKLALPVLSNLSSGTLKQNLPEQSDRSRFAPLEAFGRLMCGLAPWFELGDEGGAEAAMRRDYADLARSGLTMAVDPASPDFLNFTDGAQPLVDAAFLALAVLRAPQQLWHRSDRKTQNNLLAALRSTRQITPYYSNWILFSAMIEAMFFRVGAEWDRTRIDLALRAVESWYQGDGVFGDGPELRCDYYNSFVIQPFLLEILETVRNLTLEYRTQYEKLRRISQRYAAIQERLISPEGTYPPIGRSLAYRFGAFQLLGLMALRNELPPGLRPAQVRSALTAVIRRQIEAPGTFDERGWLQIGFAGWQTAIGEEYISVGSCYLCAAGLLPLGLPASHPFWTGPPHPWTAKRLWSGESVPPDGALHGPEF
jgi:hypothetical protein